MGEALRRIGHDVLTSFETGTAGQAIPDAEVLAFAVTQRRILLTLNRRHFIRLHEEKPDHGGIVVCTFDPDFATLAQRIHVAVEAKPDIVGQLVRVNRPA